MARYSLAELLEYARNGEVACSANLWPGRAIWARIYTRIDDCICYVHLNEANFRRLLPHLEQVRVETGRSEVTRFYKVKG